MKKTTIFLVFVSLIAISCSSTTLLDEKAGILGSGKADTAASAEPTANVMTVSAETLNVRDAPRGTVIPDIWLEHGQEVTIFERHDNWCRIDADRQYWVACWWLEEK